MSIAISMALTALGMLELPEEDQPPEEIWHHGERLDKWFEGVKQRRKNPGMAPIEDLDDEPGMVRNELVDELLGR